MSGGANHSRLTSMTDPDGYVVNYNYSSGLNDAISRLSSLSDTSGTLESYSYLGLAERRGRETCAERAIHSRASISLL